MTPVEHAFTGKRIFVAGHKGMVGSALIRSLKKIDDVTILTADRRYCDLTRQAETERWFEEHRPGIVLNAAARVGGIFANASYPAEFIYDNLMIQSNLVHAAHRVGVERFLFLGSSCIYPKFAPQPMAEGSLLTGPLEPTNQWYAIAKITGLKLIEAFRRQYGHHYISVMPANLYGYNDNFDSKNSHVLPALMRKMHEAKITGAKSVEIWGTGKALREFLHVDDMADACLFLLQHYDSDAHVNVGTGEEVSIASLARAIKEVTGYRGELFFNTDYPDGTPQKLLDSGKILNLGWRPSISLYDGLRLTYEWFLQGLQDNRLRGFKQSVLMS